MIGYLIEGFHIITNAFRQDPAVFWFLVPILLLWVTLEFYFNEYRREPLGWNSMLGNGVSFLWITIASLRAIGTAGYGNAVFWALTVLLTYGVVVIVLAYRHAISQRYTYLVAGPSTIYFLSTLAVLWGQAGIPLTGPALAFSVLMLGTVVVVFQILQRSILGIRGEAESIRQGMDPEGPRGQEESEDGI